MRWIHTFQTSKYISRLEQIIDKLAESLVSERAGRMESVNLLSQDVAELRGKLEMLEKFFQHTPQTNEIEEKEVDEIDVTDDFRIPMIDGLKVAFEGEPAGNTRPVDLHPYQAVKPRSAHAKRTKPQ